MLGRDPDSSKIMQIKKFGNDEFIVSAGNTKLVSVAGFMKEAQAGYKYNFEFLYSEPMECFSLLRCNQCGTIIHAYFDESRKEPNLKCPVCSEYKTGFKYWTRAQISASKEIQNEIKEYKNLERINRHINKHYNPKIKSDSEFAWNSFNIGDVNVITNLYCDSRMNLNKFKGLELRVTVKDGMSTVSRFIIPLSIESILFHYDVNRDTISNYAANIINKIKSVF